MKYIIWLFRIALGCLFIFSGIVKANDPLGLAYKMTEIFETWDMNWMAQYSFAFSVGMIAFEVVAFVVEAKIFVKNPFVEKIDESESEFAIKVAKAPMFPVIFVNVVEARVDEPVTIKLSALVVEELVVDA